MTEHYMGILPVMSPKSREDILNKLLQKATNFYEETIGILSGIFKLAEFVNTRATEDMFYDYIVRVLTEESRCENASIFVIKEDKLLLKAAHGSSVPSPNKNVVINMGSGVAGTCAAKGKSILLDDVNHSELFEEWNSKVKIGSILCVPIKEGNAVIGVLNLSHSSVNFFNEHHVRMFELLGLLVGQMLAIVRLYEALKKEFIDMEKVIQEQEINLKDISQQYKVVVNATEECILLLDGMDIRFYNRAFEKIAGKPFPTDLEHLFDPETLDDIVTRINSMAADKGASFEREVRIGSTPTIAAQFFIKRLSSENQTLIIMEDITMKRYLEQRSAQTEKLTSIGLLTSGIAHELNNKLTPILGFADLLDTSALSPIDQERVNIIINSASAAKKTLESLLTFSRNLPHEKRILDVGEMIDKSVRLYSPLLKKRDITINYETSDRPLKIKGDMDCIEQVLVNLINNAIDAIGEENGNITIRASLANDFVNIEIEDTGPGIPNEIKTKIFDPFFTTKSQGKGTGLGLSICYGIIQDHEGDLSLENTGHGACAKIKLPAYKGGEDVQDYGMESLHQSHETKAKRSKKKEKPLIMLVEDEKDLMTLMVDVLSPEFNVACFINGKEALEHLDDHNWDLMISDLRMPEMNGMEFYRQVLEVDDQLKDRFIFVTGDTYDMNVRKFLEDTGLPFLKKPFRIKELLNVVRQRLS